MVVTLAHQNRYLYIRILSLRPLLLVMTKRVTTGTVQGQAQPSVSSLDDMVFKHCYNLCVHTAHRLIETIHRYLDTTYRSSGWHAVYCTRSSTRFSSNLIDLSQLPLPPLRSCLLRGSSAAPSLNRRTRSRRPGSDASPF